MALDGREADRTIRFDSTGYGDDREAYLAAAHTEIVQHAVHWPRTKAQYRTWRSNRKNGDCRAPGSSIREVSTGQRHTLPQYRTARRKRVAAYREARGIGVLRGAPLVAAYARSVPHIA
eukprot:3641006-Rhodomonas_salina.1